jgi:hypothetical protein
MHCRVPAGVVLEALGGRHPHSLLEFTD